MCSGSNEFIDKYDPRTKFFLDPEYRKDFLNKIKEQQVELARSLEEKKLNKGKPTFTLEQISKIHTILGGKFMGIPRNKSEVEMFTPGEIAEILFRDHLYEIPIHGLESDKITGIERVKIIKPELKKPT